MKQHNQQTLFTWPRLRQAFTAILLVVFSFNYSSAQESVTVTGSCPGMPWILEQSSYNGGVYAGFVEAGPPYGTVQIYIGNYGPFTNFQYNIYNGGQELFTGSNGSPLGIFTPSAQGMGFCESPVTVSLACSEIAWYRDADGDTYGTPNDMVMSCTEVDGYVANDFDCDDTHPQLPQTWFIDSDGDGYGSTGTTIWTCEQPEGYAPQPCSAPIGASVSSITSVNAKVDFDGLPEGAFRCVVWFRPVGTEEYRQAGATTGTRVNLNGLAPGTEYEWKMRTRCGSETGDTSAFVSGPNFTTLDPCTESVDGVTVFASANWVRLKWQEAPNAVSYRLRYKLRSGGVWKSKTIAAPTLTNRINSLLEATEYEYTLQAVCTNGVLSSQSAGTFTTPLSTSRLSDGTATDWSFTIHPNPSNGRFTVTPLADAEGVATVQLFDVAGRIVFTQTWNPSEDATLVLDKQLDNGIYMLSITAGDGHQFSSRVVIAN